MQAAVVTGSYNQQATESQQEPSGEVKSAYELCKKGLLKPDSRKELYLSEFNVRSRCKTED